MIEYINTHQLEFWYLLGAILMVAEMIMGGTIVTFFAGMAAFSVALVMKFELITLNSMINQVGAFSLFLCIWGVVLWKPVKYLLNLGATKGYNNFEGTAAIVYSDVLGSKKVGEIKWSGAVCKAKLISSDAELELKKGESVTINSVENNIFLVEKV
jgi:membrane protein implicated in regulation of membrane protease activity